MVADGTYTAVLDRFEGEYPILVLEADGEAVDDVMVDPTVLPDESQHQDAVFTVEISDTEVVAVQYESDTTDERQDAAQDRFNRLSERLSDDEE